MVHYHTWRRVRNLSLLWSDMLFKSLRRHLRNAALRWSFHWWNRWHIALLAYLIYLKSGRIVISWFLLKLDWRMSCCPLKAILWLSGIEIYSLVLNVLIFLIGSKLKDIKVLVNYIDVICKHVQVIFILLVSYFCDHFSFLKLRNWTFRYYLIIQQTKFFSIKST